jgi:hypothetical protein
MASLAAQSATLATGVFCRDPRQRNAPSSSARRRSLSER